MATNPTNPETLLGNTPLALTYREPGAIVEQFDDMTEAGALARRLGSDYTVTAGVEKCYAVRKLARELPSPFTVEVDAILTQGEVFMLLRRAGLKLVDRGENHPYLLTVEPQSLLSRIGQMEATRAAVNAEARRIKRAHDEWNGPVSPDVARRRRGEYTREEVNAGINDCLERGFE